MSAPRKASAAQAKRIAQLFWSGHNVSVGEDRVNSTDKALIAAGWLVDTGRRDLWPNGSPVKIFQLHDSGLDALETFLSQLRYARIAKAQAARRKTGTGEGAIPT